MRRDTNPTLSRSQFEPILTKLPDEVTAVQVIFAETYDPRSIRRCPFLQYPVSTSLHANSDLVSQSLHNR